MNEVGHNSTFSIIFYVPDELRDPDYFKGELISTKCASVGHQFCPTITFLTVLGHLNPDNPQPVGFPEFVFALQVEWTIDYHHGVKFHSSPRNDMNSVQSYLIPAYLHTFIYRLLQYMPLQVAYCDRHQ